MEITSYINEIKKSINKSRNEIEAQLQELKEKGGNNLRKTSEYHQAKDLLNETDKKLDRLTDESKETWKVIQDDINEMMKRVQHIVKSN